MIAVDFYKENFRAYLISWGIVSIIGGVIMLIQLELTVIKFVYLIVVAAGLLFILETIMGLLLYRFERRYK